MLEFEKVTCRVYENNRAMLLYRTLKAALFRLEYGNLSDLDET